MVAASTVAFSSPTPIPFSRAWLARVPVILLAKACKKQNVGEWPMPVVDIGLHVLKFKKTMEYELSRVVLQVIQSYEQPR